jgi:hypothetical protein
VRGQEFTGIIIKMKFFSIAPVSFLTLSLTTSNVLSFQQSTGSDCGNLHFPTTTSKSNGSLTPIERRHFVQFGAAAFIGLALTVRAPPSVAGLLDEFGSDPSKIDSPKKVSRETVKITQKTESDLEPNLRSNYYYPTNKKRYLPRIKKCNDAIPEVAKMIGKEDWLAAADFADKVAEDTILPMKLYTSSLLGGGTNVKVSFTKDMNKAAVDFEKAQKQLSNSIAKKDIDKSTKALEDLSKALLTYRTVGKLLGPDGGGDIPSVDDIRRSASRTQKLMFEEKMRTRDERVKAEASSST